MATTVLRGGEQNSAQTFCVDTDSWKAEFPCWSRKKRQSLGSHQQSWIIIKFAWIINPVQSLACSAAGIFKLSVLISLKSVDAISQIKTSLAGVCVLQSIPGQKDFHCWSKDQLNMVGFMDVDIGTRYSLRWKLQVAFVNLQLGIFKVCFPVKSRFDKWSCTSLPW